MKKNKRFNLGLFVLDFLGALFILALLSACGSGAKTKSTMTPMAPIEAEALAESAAQEAPPPPPAASFDSIKNIVWQLIDVKIGFGSIVIDRELLAAGNINDYFTLQFVQEGVNGKAAPNRYFAPYALLDGNNTALRPIAGTMLAQDTSLVIFNEQRYFDILQKMVRWDYQNDYLYIYSSGTNEAETIILIFNRNDS